MQLTQYGTIKHEGYLLSLTQDGRWAISKPSPMGSTYIGYVDMLSDIDTFITARKDKARARLAEVQAKHEARTQQQ